MTEAPKFVVLMILDGWGLAPPGPGNAIDLASTPNMHRLMASYPHTELEASGQAVGLPRGEDGNTETGHLNIGAGIIVYQALERINMSIAEGSFFQNEILNGAIDHAESNNSNVHLMGLIGAGGVHSDIEHLFALIQLARRRTFTRVFLHLFTDGRDSPTTAAKTYISEIKRVMDNEKVGQIASVMGRYWAMDRDQRWERTKRAYEALTLGVGNHVERIEDAIDQSYSKGKTDEFIEPTLLTKNNEPVALIKENDSVIFFNFRIDRPRQLSKAFVFDEFEKANLTYDFDPHRVKYEKSHEQKNPLTSAMTFDRKVKISNLYFATMTEYSKALTEQGAKTAFPPIPVNEPLGKVVSENGLKQLRITESEKERFVTFYFNGLREAPFKNEDRIIIPSPSVPTYDQKPEMSSDLVTSTVLEKLKANEYSLTVLNFPNADMVGHTGNIGPAVKAIETLDDCIGKIANYVHAYDGLALITADHGNAEEMINKETGEIDTEHSINRVPFIAVSKRLLGGTKSLPSGILADIAPTILSVMNLPIPSSMTGRNLLEGIWI